MLPTFFADLKLRPGRIPKKEKNDLQIQNAVYLRNNMMYTNEYVQDRSYVLLCKASLVSFLNRLASIFT